MRGVFSYCFTAMLLLANLASAQLVINAGYTPQQLVEDVLIGQGVQVSNIQFTGDPASRGYFDGSNSNIGLNAGVILSTGKAVDAVGPNSTTAGSVSEEGTNFMRPGNPQLTAISGSLTGTFDASVLEFDFIPSSDTVRFRFVFASNEYMFWVGTSNINDLFAFFLSGPGITGSMNVALIPGTTTPITMVDVNANTNSQYYVDNGDQSNEQGGLTVNYNGFTTALTAQAVLTPCETYHIRLAIADGGDGLYDSAVFLEEGSFTSPSVSIDAESTFSTSATAQELVEGCSSMTLTFERSEPFDAPLSIGLAFSGTATVGVDVSNIPNSITFPAGQATTSLTFNVLEDGIVEGTESMTIVLDQLNPCATGPATSASFTIQDVQPMTVQTSPDASFVCPEEYTIDATVSGGYPGYSYQWSGATDTDESITVNPLSTTTYAVIVTDACGFTATSNTTVTMAGYQPLRVTVADVVVCNGDDALLESAVTGGLGTITYQWDGGGSGPTFSVSPSSSITVNLQVSDSCGLSASTAAEVVVDDMLASFTHHLIAHSTVQFNNTSANAVSSSWEFGDGLGSNRESPSHEYEIEGDYIVRLTVTNVNGCESTVEDTVTVYPPFHVYIPNAFTPNGDGVNDVFGLKGEGYLYYDLEIFDRWGNRMRHGRFRDDTAWDGKYKGQLVPSGAYVYKVFVQPPIGIEVREAGVLHVLSGE